jgi:hypothetical protein
MWLCPVESGAEVSASLPKLFGIVTNAILETMAMAG